MSYSYFIHFGCWNNGGCPKDNAMTQVLRAIQRRPTPPQFLSICGDNYYPKKTKDKDGNKQKFYNYVDLLSGFQCLPADLPIYMTYGNHDFETGLYVASEKETTCTLTHQEQTLVKEQFPNIHLQLFQSASFQNTQLLFLDTTVYDPEDIDECIRCYSAINPAYVDIEAIKQAQLQFIRAFVASIPPDIQNIVIVGHHPLAQYKEKKEKIKFLVLNEEFNDLLFEEIYVPLKSRTNNMQYYYLCADLHQYQCGNIVIHDEMPIRQYIVGTGGAEKDAYNLTAARTNIASNLQYSMTEEDVAQSCAENGYLTCTAMGADLEFAFVKVQTDASEVGGRRMTKRRTMTKKRAVRKNKSQRTKSQRTKSQRKIN